MEHIKNIPTLPARKPDAHKGDFGRVGIVAGCLGMTGAAAIAGRSTLRAGAGLVRIATPQSALPIVAAIEPCFTTTPLPQDDNGQISTKAVEAVLKLAAQNDVMAFGPGLGTSRGVKDVLNALITIEGLRLIIDADGLNCLAKIIDWPERKKASIILTPHPGEMKRLWAGLFRDPMPAERVAQAGAVAKKTGSTVVLKGAETVISDSDKFYINTTGNPGMATAGSGDVLTGVIAAIVAQGLNDFDASVLGVYVHGLAGDIAAEKFGQISLIATDIIEQLTVAFVKLK